MFIFASDSSLLLSDSRLTILSEGVLIIFTA